MKKMPNIPVCDECIILTGTIFRHLSPEEILQVNFEKDCNFYKKGSIIYNEGSHVNGFYCINSGIIKLYKTGTEGKEQIINFAEKPDIIGYRSLLSGELSCHTAKVLEDAVLCSIPGEALFGLLKKNSSFSLEIVQLLCRKLGEANSFITDIAQKTVRERLAEALILLKNKFGVNEDSYLNIRLTREEIANIIGTASESVIRLLSDFKEEQLIDINGRSIKILDEKKLKRTANIFS